MKNVITTLLSVAFFVAAFVQVEAKSLDQNETNLVVFADVGKEDPTQIVGSTVEVVKVYSLFTELESQYHQVATLAGEVGLYQEAKRFNYCKRHRVNLSGDTIAANRTRGSPL